MSEKTFNCKATIVENSNALYVYEVSIEDGNFSGKGRGIFLGEAFEEAFEDLMLKVDPNFKLCMG
jgi:hypothetical protein